ncbi:MAG: molybdenum ABC transporter ATP-binding protein [Pseudomonadota bacterium]
MIELKVNKKLPEFELDVDLQIANSGISALFGPSGSGKTTLLNCIAGFSECEGSIAFSGTPWLDSLRQINLPPHKRPVGTVFQDTRLFAHLSVRGNLEYAIKRHPDATLSLKDVSEQLNLNTLLERPIRGLSGGEQQRVAIARALLSHAELLLLDEPFAALDHQAKEDLIPYIHRINSEFDQPVIMVSHILEEVIQLADDVVAMQNGRVIDQGPTRQVIAAAADNGLAPRTESGSMLRATYRSFDDEYQLARLSLEGFPLRLPGIRPLQPEADVRLLIRAKDVSLAVSAPQNLSVQNVLRGTINEIRVAPDTPFAEVIVQIGRQQLRARVTRMAVDDLGLEITQQVFALIKSVSFDH